MSPTMRSLVAAALLMPWAVPAAAAQRATSVPAVEAQAPQQIFVSTDVTDAREVRERFEGLLRRLPPSVGRVLKTDPTLMTNEAYLATYPALAAFLKQSPEVRHNPGFYLSNISQEFWEPRTPPDPRSEALRMWRDTMQTSALFAGFTIVTLTLVWIVRSLIEYRRWHRTARVQAEVHNKLLDRFTANEDLLAYIQTPAGRRFLESAPVPLESPAPPVAAPLARIMWSIQAGVVLAAGALGLLFVSGRVIEEVSQPLFVIGVLALAVGAGFVISAAASFLLSRRLGLFDGAPPAAREQSAGISGS